MIERAIERILVSSRWLLAPFYLGLVVILLVVMFKFSKELVHFVLEANTLSEEEIVTGALSVIDLTLLGSLILIVIFSGYENFVSKIDGTGHDNWPDWMTKVDFVGPQAEARWARSSSSRASSSSRPSCRSSGRPTANCSGSVTVHMVFVTSSLLPGRCRTGSSPRPARTCTEPSGVVRAPPAPAGRRPDRSAMVSGGFGLAASWAAWDAARRPRTSSRAPCRSHRRPAAGPAACRPVSPGRAGEADVEMIVVAIHRAHLGEPGRSPSASRQIAFLIAALTKMRSTCGSCAARRTTAIWLGGPGAVDVEPIGAHHIGRPTSSRARRRQRAVRHRRQPDVGVETDLVGGVAGQHRPAARLRDVADQDARASRRRAGTCAAKRSRKAISAGLPQLRLRDRRITCQVRPLTGRACGAREAALGVEADRSRREIGRGRLAPEELLGRCRRGHGCERGQRRAGRRDVLRFGPAAGQCGHEAEDREGASGRIEHRWSPRPRRAVCRAPVHKCLTLGQRGAPSKGRRCRPCVGGRTAMHRLDARCGRS